MTKRQLIFRTITMIENGQDVTYCYPRKDGTWLKHRKAAERNKTGHYPGFIYLLKLPNGFYKIGKCENTEVEIDDFDLDEMHERMLKRMRDRLWRIQISKHQSDEYKNFKFVHAIRVACGEGAEKQPFIFYNSQVKSPGAEEIFELTDEDVEAFTSATGEILWRSIKHVTAGDFKHFLDSIGEKRIKVEGFD